jgi:hypothetical protein
MERTRIRAELDDGSPPRQQTVHPQLACVDIAAAAKDSRTTSRVETLLDEKFLSICGSRSSAPGSHDPLRRGLA